jgi:hypothetical protein
LELSPLYLHLGYIAFVVKVFPSVHAQDTCA